MLRTPYLPGETDMDQLKTIFRALGTPTEDDWPVSLPVSVLPDISADDTRIQGHTKLPDYVPVGQFAKTPFRDLFTAASSDCLNLLGKCLIYDPRRRISAKDVSIIQLSAAISLTMLTSTAGPQPPLLLRPPLPYNPSGAEKCTVCDSPREDKPKPAVQGFDWSKAGMKPPPKPAGDTWSCSVCMLSNPGGADKCTVCDSPR